MYVTIAKSVKTIASIPEAKPSSPSVRLTAFVVPSKTNIMNGRYKKLRSKSIFFINSMLVRYLKLE